MKFHFLLFIGLLAQFSLFAQEDAPIYNNEEYSLVDDHTFAKIHDFYGYTFVPCQGKLDFAHYPDPVPAGWVRFTVNRHEIKILERTEYRPGGIEVLPNRNKEYRLRITEVEDRGVAVKFRVSDPMYPDMPGYVYLQKDGLSRIVMLKYLPGPSDHERIYIMKYATPEQLAADQQYFTHQEDIKTDTDTLFWGRTLYPFKSYTDYYDYYNIKIKRLKPDDGYNINFFEKTVIGKKDKEITVQYISFVENSEKKMQLVFKKSEEVLVNHRDGNRKALELECFDEVTKEQYFIILHRGVSTYLKSIEVQMVENKQRKTIMYYTMRKGKSTVFDASTTDEEEKEKPEPKKEEKEEEEEEKKPKKKKKKKEKKTKKDAETEEENIPDDEDSK